MDAGWLITGIFGLAGAYLLLGSIFNWDLLIRGNKAHKVTGVLGEKGARILYGVLGAIFLIIAAVSQVQVPA